MQFKKATREQARLRLALMGPAGSGKTYTAILLAVLLGKRVAVIDTERGSASKYAGKRDAATGAVLDFDSLEPETFSPETYVQAIHAAEAAGYDVLVIDSLSHAWMGKGGALELVDNAAKRSQSGGNNFTAWREVTPKHNLLVDTILSSRCHVVATMRTKTEYTLEENERGKKVPKKIGLAPVQRDGLEYEFDVVGDLDLEHNLIVGKTRCSEIEGKLFPRPGRELAAMLTAWLTDGAPRGAAPAPAQAPAATAQPQPAALPPGTKELEAQFVARIGAAASLDELNAIPPHVDGHAWPPAAKERIKAAFAARKSALAADWDAEPAPAPAADPSGAQLADEFIAQIKREVSLESLSQIPGRVKDLNLPEADKARVRAAYGVRRGELQAAQQAGANGAAAAAQGAQPQSQGAAA